MKLNLLNDMARTCRLLSLLLLLAVGLAGCKTSRHSSSLSGESACLSSKVQLTVPHKDATLTVNGTMKLKKEECMQISFLMPILRTEVARMEVTPDEILLVDRMGKRYVRATRKELKDVLPMKAQFNIGDSPEETYRGGMEYYSTMLHEMTHSTMTPERLNREMGGRFGDPKYAKEELVAELTAAMISHSMGFDSRITDNSAAYLDSWIGVLKQEPKFIVSVMADVNKASDLILDHVDRQRLALGEQPYLAKNDPLAPVSADEEMPFRNAAIVKTRSGDYAIRASYDGVELGLKKVSKETAKTFFQLTDWKDKETFLNMTARKTYEPEITMLGRNRNAGTGLGI